MNFSRGVGGSLSPLWKFRRGGGPSVSCKNGKSRGVGGGVLSEIPSVVGVWIFSGTTQFRFHQSSFVCKSAERKKMGDLSQVYKWVAATYS